MSSDDATSVQGRKVLLCVTGGIAAYKAAFVARALVGLGADVRVLMTDAATEFVGPQTFSALTGNRVHRRMFDSGPDVVHVELARGADLAVVAPATANTIAKMAHGFADDLVSSTLLTVRCPILVAPAMHTEMWEKPATRENLSVLTARGVVLVGPEDGELSSGDFGKGRLAEPGDIVRAAVDRLGKAQDLAGRRIVVTAAGTQEPLDPVRFIGNRSSGLMGFTIADEALRRGAKVTLVSGPTNLDPPGGAELINVKTAQEMWEAVRSRAASADVMIKAAAVADFRPSASHEAKLKKAQGPPEITLEPTIDILKELGHHPEYRKQDGILVGFAAETEADPARLAEVAGSKRSDKGADIIVANDVGSTDSGFDVPTNRAVIAGPDGCNDIGLVTKMTLAEALIDRIVTLLE